MQSGITFFSKLLIISLAALLGSAETAHARIAPTDPVLSLDWVTDTEIKVSWTASTAAAGIKYYHMDVVNPSNGQVMTSLNNMSPGTRSFTLTGFPNFTFRFVLKAEDNNGAFSNNVTLEATTLSDPPPTPPTDPALSVSTATETAITVSWTASTSSVGIKNYHMEIADPSSGAVLIPSTPLAANSSSFTLNGSAGTTYRFKLRAEDNDGNFSNEVILDASTLDPPVQTPPTDPVLSLSSATETQITVSWTSSSSDAGIQNYYLDVVDPSSGTSLSSNMLASTTNDFTLNGQPNTSYRIKLKAEDTNGLFSNEVILDASTLDNTTPTGPTNPIASDEEVCLSDEEKTLYLEVNSYRAANGLAPIPLSRKLTKLAQLHAMDNQNYPPTDPNCNGHSWSANGAWNACCYTSDHANAGCIWDKPSEIVGYNATGYENYAWSSGNLTGIQTLDMWKNSAKHNDVILNLNIWTDKTWRALGVGIYQGTAYLWVGELEDGQLYTTAESITCDGGGSNPDGPVADNSVCIDELCDNLTVGENGNIGIGKTPDANHKLDVNGTVNATDFIGDGSALTNLDAANLVGTISVPEIEAGRSVIKDFEWGPANTFWAAFFNKNAATYPAIAKSGGGETSLWGNKIALRIGDSQAMAVENDRTVYVNKQMGIGTNNPTEALEVIGGVRATNFMGDGSALTNLDAANIIGLPSFISNAENLFIGDQAAANNTTGTWNLFLGSKAGQNNTSGNLNVFLGSNAGKSNTSANSNVFVGSNAGEDNTTGHSNVFLGGRAGEFNTTAAYNVFVGERAGVYNETGESNVYLGRGAGQNNLDGSNNVFIGSYAGGEETGSNKLYIDNSDTATPLIFGDFANDQLAFNGNVNVGSSTTPANLTVSGTIDASQVLVNGAPITAAGSTYWDAIPATNDISYTGNGTVRITNGDLVAKRIAVAPNPATFNAWPDYVFADDYDLPDLIKVESYIRENKHLPEVPSAKEVAAKGFDVADMDATLLKKIEELTLYIIEQNKRIEQLEAKMAIQK